MTDPAVVLRLPDDLREDLKEPLGPIHTEVASLVEDLGIPIITVGDVVSYHYEQAEQAPDVAVIDGRSKRQAVDPEIADALADVSADRIEAENPPGTITQSLLLALRQAIDRAEPVQIVVDGEEDLATLPAILLAPAGASVLYGQPGVGMVHVAVDADSRAHARQLLSAMEGDHDQFSALLPG